MASSRESKGILLNMSVVTLFIREKLNCLLSLKMCKRILASVCTRKRNIVSVLLVKFCFYSCVPRKNVFPSFLAGWRFNRRK